MPIINPVQTDKFQAITNRIKSKQRADKQIVTSLETLKTFTVKPKPQSPTQVEAKLLTGSTIPNSTIRQNVLKLDSHMQTKSGDHIYLSSSVVPNLGKETLHDTSSSSSIGLQTPGKLRELKAMHQKLVQITQVPEPNKPTYEPRRPTLESLKAAIAKAKQEKDENELHKNTHEQRQQTLESIKAAIAKAKQERDENERHKNVGTDDLILHISSKSDAITSTDSKPEASTKGKKGRKISSRKVSQNIVVRTKKKTKKNEAKVKSSVNKKKS